MSAAMPVGRSWGRPSAQSIQASTRASDQPSGAIISTTESLRSTQRGPVAIRLAGSMKREAKRMRDSFRRKVLPD